MVKSLKLNLYLSGNSPELAHALNSKHTVEAYEKALDTEEYYEFCDIINKDMRSGLIPRLYNLMGQIQNRLDLMGLDDKVGVALIKEYKECIKLALDSVPENVSENANVEIVDFDDAD